MEPESVVTLALLSLLVGALVGAVAASAVARGRTLSLRAERDTLARQLEGAERAAARDREVASTLAPVREALGRLESQVHDLERDRSEQFGRVGERLSQVVEQTAALREQTAGLSGALHASGTRGTWGEAQLRRVLEHAGMLPRCDFEEQVRGVSRHEARVRPDVLVHLPGGKCLVIDAKAPMTSFLQAQAEDLDAADRQGLLQAHARSLRGHVDALSGKAYWSAFSTTPEMVVCFVPSDAVLAAALRAQPDLYERAQSRKVVLASPATLLALLRATAFAWQQDALAGSARQLLELGTQLHERLGTLGRHAARMGTALRRSVESYNAFVGTLESRVMVTSRRMHELGVTEADHPRLTVVDATPRALTDAALIDGLGDGDGAGAVGANPALERRSG